MSISRKAIGIFSIAAIVAIGTLTLVSGVASAGVIHVPGDYATIQAAINAVDADNRTIEVNATTYTAKETIDVTQPNIIIRSVNGRAVIDANGTDDHVVDITDQTNVTLEGFEIRDAQGTTQDVAGIRMHNASWCTISNNTVTNISTTDVLALAAYGIDLLESNNNTFRSNTTVSDITGDRASFGIHLLESNNNTFRSNTTVSYLDGSVAEGIVLYQSSDNSFSSSVTVSCVNATGDASGIDLTGQSRDNTFSSSTIVSYINAGWDAKAIWLRSLSNNNTFSSSTTVSHVNATDDASGIILYQSSDNSFSSSTTVSHVNATNDASGIFMYDSNNNNFSSSTFVSDITATDGDAYGIWLYWFSNNNNFSSSTSISAINALGATGIYLDTSHTNCFSNTTINAISALGAMGINLDTSHTNRFSNTTISTVEGLGGDGIELSNSHDNRFTNTRIRDIFGEIIALGVYLNSSHNNSFTDFTIADMASDGGTESYGVYIDESSNNNVFSGGDIYSTGDPLILYAVWLENCTHNTINESEIWNNGHGFWLNQSDNNTIERNMIVNNKAPFLPISGAFLTTGSDNNKLNGNCFYFNGWDHQAWDDGIDNDWTGNFWDDWSGSGPYLIGGSANNSDNNPLDECLEGAAPAFWDPGDDYKIHYPQLPDPEGWDVFNSRSCMLADDWQCSETGPVTYIHIWGSWRDDRTAIDVQVFHLEIWDNNASGLYSKPGERLWQGDFNTRDYTVRWNDTGRQGFYSPQFGFYNYLSNNHNLTYQYNFYIEPAYAFNQTEGNIYWLVVASNLTEEVPFSAFGLKTSNSTQFGDNAVFWNNSIADWSELIDPITYEPLDLAFVIAGEPQPQPSPVPALTPVGLLALVSLLSVIAAVTLTRRKRR